jgi:cbb3-type cytochrome oxidase subunit 3
MYISDINELFYIYLFLFIFIFLIILIAYKKQKRLKYHSSIEDIKIKVV